jgi:hypothetical protein
MTDLPTLVKEINHRWEQADRLDGQADDHRIAAGIRLAEARGIVGDTGWQKWCAEHIPTRSIRDVYRLLKIGQAGDPQKALSDEREQNREAQRKSRAKVTPPPDMSVRTKAQPPLRQALDLLPKLTPDEKKAIVEFAGHDFQKALPVPAKTTSPRDALIKAIEAVDDDTLADVLIRIFWHRIGDVLARKIGETESHAKAPDDVAAQAVNRPAAESGASRASGDAGTAAPDSNPMPGESRHGSGGSVRPLRVGDDPAGTPAAPAETDSERREGSPAPEATPTPTSPGGQGGTAAPDPYAGLPDIPAQFRRA